MYEVERKEKAKKKEMERREWRKTLEAIRNAVW